MMETIADYDSVERDLLIQINQLRRQPHSFLPLLRRRLKCFRNIGADTVYYISNDDVNAPGPGASNEKKVTVRSRRIRTREGKTPVIEAIRELQLTAPMPQLVLSPEMCLASGLLLKQLQSPSVWKRQFEEKSSSGKRLSRFGKWKGACAENVCFSRQSRANAIIVQMLIDDGLSSRRHRRNLLNPSFRFVGIRCGHQHELSYHVVVLDLSASFISTRQVRDNLREGILEQRRQTHAEDPAPQQVFKLISTFFDQFSSGGSFGSGISLLDLQSFVRENLPQSDERVPSSMELQRMFKGAGKPQSRLSPSDSDVVLHVSDVLAAAGLQWSSALRVWTWSNTAVAVYSRKWIKLIELLLMKMIVNDTRSAVSAQHERPRRKTSLRQRSLHHSLSMPSMGHSRRSFVHISHDEEGSGDILPPTAAAGAAAQESIEGYERHTNSKDKFLELADRINDEAFKPYKKKGETTTAPLRSVSATTSGSIGFSAKTAFNNLNQLLLGSAIAKSDAERKKHSCDLGSIRSSSEGAGERDHQHEAERAGENDQLQNDALKLYGNAGSVCDVVWHQIEEERNRTRPTLHAMYKLPLIIDEKKQAAARTVSKLADHSTHLQEYAYREHYKPRLDGKPDFSTNSLTNDSDGFFDNSTHKTASLPLETLLEQTADTNRWIEEIERIQNCERRKAAQDEYVYESRKNPDGSMPTNVRLLANAIFDQHLRGESTSKGEKMKLSGGSHSLLVNKKSPKQHLQTDLERLLESVSDEYAIAATMIVVGCQVRVMHIDGAYWTTMTTEIENTQRSSSRGKTAFYHIANVFVVVGYDYLSNIKETAA